MFCLVPLGLVCQISSRKSKLQLNLGLWEEMSMLYLGYPGRIHSYNHHHFLSNLCGQEQSFTLYVFFLIHVFSKSINVLERTNKRISNRVQTTHACRFLSNPEASHSSRMLLMFNEILRISRLGMKS